MSSVRKLLLAVFLVALTGSAFGAGTFATFNASTTNGGATFATGTIVLSNQKDANTACLSTGANTTIGDDDTDNAFACDVLFTLSLKKPGDTATVDLTLQNVGTLGATTLKGFRSVACSTGNDAGTYHGSGDLCPNVELTIQQYSSAANRTSNNTTGGMCWYGGGSGGASCSFDGTRDLEHFSNTYTSGTVGQYLDLGAAAAGEQRFLRVSLQIPSTVGNSLQGRQATFGFTWGLDQ